jgi:sugar phosphate permease
MMGNYLRGNVLRYRWVIFGMMAAVYISAFFHRVSPAVVALDIQQSLGISASLVGLLSSAYFYSYAAVQLPAGLLSDSLGPRRSVTVFLIIGAVGSILFGWAPGLGVAIFGRVLVGLGAGMAWTPAMKIISHWFRRHEFSTVSGLMLSMGGMGALIAAAPLAWLKELLGWQLTFELIGLVTIGLALIVWLVVRDRPQDLGWPGIEEVNAEPVQEIGLLQGARQVVTEKYFWPLAVWAFFTMGSYFVFAGLWAGPYLVHVYGLTAPQAGMVLNMLAVGIVVGSLFWSFVSERVLRSRKKTLILASGAYVGLLVLLNLLPKGLPIGSLYPLFFIFALCSLAVAAIMITATKELFPLEITGTSIGTVNLFPFLGTAIMQVAAGWLLDRYPQSASGEYPIEAYSAVLCFILAAALIGFASTFVMKETFSSSTK